MERKTNVLALPKHIKVICNVLEEAGFAAYAVGGCVRDMLRGEAPHDYDVATAARPEEMKALFPHTVDTGLMHGTVTVVLPEGNVEVTTFRQDGAYADSRHPDAVTFVSQIEADLARRDFTVNAMAYSEKRGFCDPFGGRGDLNNKILRTVGEPQKRFGEDALRILRLYRFSAQLSFAMEAETEEAARLLAPTLSHVSRERIFAELDKLLGYASAKDLKHAETVFRAVMPIGPLTAENCDKIEKCTAIAGKWAHLCGKSADEILRGLRAPRALILSAGELANYKKGKHIVSDVAHLRHSAPDVFFAYLQNEAAEEAWQSARATGVPMRIDELSVSGEDMKTIGFDGREIGEVLERLFMYAIENPANTKKEILMEVATWIYKQEH